MKRLRPFNELPDAETLKTLTSLNKEVRPFFLSDHSIWSYPSVCSLSDYSINLEVLKAILALRS